MSQTGIRVALLTAGQDRHYALGLAPALAQAGVEVELIGNSEMGGFPAIQHPNIRFFNLRGDMSANAPFYKKACRVLSYYLRLFLFCWKSQSKIFHILWPNKFVHFDRTILNLYYRSWGKKLVFTAHNVNTEARDLTDSALNRLSLRIQYHLMDHIFVHTPKMQNELAAEYAVTPNKITSLTYPINNVVPTTNLTRENARRKLGIPSSEKTVLFFGNIAAYKGVEDLIRALPLLRGRLRQFRVLLVGRVREERYFNELRELIYESGVTDLVHETFNYVPDDQVEVYFKAADVLVLPYRRIFQSGVLFLSYGFGLPVIVSDAGSLGTDVIEGQTGFVSPHSDPI